MKKVDSNTKRCLIIANGKSPSKRVFTYFMKAGFSFIICADGGANTAFKKGITPDVIVGDLDSIDNAVLKYFKNKSEVIHYARQNDTDVEKAFKYAISHKFVEAVLCGGTGDRLDHTFCNIGVVLKFSNKIKLFLHHENSVMYVCDGKEIINTVPNETISFYGIDNKTRFTSKGLKYPLRNVTMPFGVKESTSNQAKGREVTLHVSGGKGLVVRDFNNIVKHGNFFNS